MVHESYAALLWRSLWLNTPCITCSGASWISTSRAYRSSRPQRIGHFPHFVEPHYIAATSTVAAFAVDLHRKSCSLFRVLMEIRCFLAVPTAVCGTAAGKKKKASDTNAWKPLQLQQSATWRLLYSSLLVATCLLNCYRDENILPQKELHRSLQVASTLITAAAWCHAGCLRGCTCAARSGDLCSRSPKLHREGRFSYLDPPIHLY